MNAILTLPFRLLAVLLLTVALSNQSPAEEEKIPVVTTSNGKTYHNVRIMKVTPSDVSILHDDGAVRIPLSELPDDLKTKLGYDPKKAAEHKEMVAMADAAQQKQNAEAARKAEVLKKASSMSGRVYYIANDFVVIEANEVINSAVASSSQSNGGGGGYYAPGASQVSSKPKHKKIFGIYVVTNVPGLSKLADNDHVEWLVTPTGATRQVGGNTFKVCQYVGIDK